MDNKAIEMKAKYAVCGIIIDSEFLDPFISENDKTPIFDGFIMVYSTPGKKAEDYVDRISVQVKGTQKKVRAKDMEFKHSFSTSDLRAYLAEGGVVYFVVHISPSGKVKRIFYEDLLPMKIHKILEVAGSQTTITRKLKPFPTDAKALPSLFNSFLEHKNRQAVLHNLKKIPTIDDLQKNGQLNEITFTTAGPHRHDSSIEAMLNDEVYMYVTLKGSEIHIPVDLIADTVERAVSHQVNSRISVNGQEFYKEYTVIRKSTNETIFRFGESITLTFPANSPEATIKATMNYTPCNSLRQRVIDLDFLISLVSADGMEFDGKFKKLSLDVKPLPENATEEVEYWKKAVQALDALHVAEDIDIKSLTDADFRELSVLIGAFVDNQPIPNINKDLPLNYIASVGKLKIALVHAPQEDTENVSRIYDFFANELIFGFSLTDEPGTPQHFVPPCAVFDKDAWGAISNINYEDILPSFLRTFAKHKDKYIFSVANNTLLSILLAYDETGKEPLLSSAQQLSEWMLKECTDEILDKHILMLNYFQVIKRSRGLDKAERAQLHEIAVASTIEERMKVGAYLLLGNHDAAELHFEKLDSETQKNFCEWPIYYFWNRQIDSEAAQ